MTVHYSSNFSAMLGVRAGSGDIEVFFSDYGVGGTGGTGGGVGPWPASRMMRAAL